MKKILIVVISLWLFGSMQAMNFYYPKETDETSAQHFDDIENNDANQQPTPQSSSYWGRVWNLPSAAYEKVTTALGKAADFLVAEDTPFPEEESEVTDQEVKIEVIIRNPEEPPFVEQKKQEEPIPAPQVPHAPEIDPATISKKKKSKFGYACFAILGLGLSVLLYKYYKKTTTTS